MAASSMKDLFGFVAKDESLKTEGQILRLGPDQIEVKPQVRKHFDEEDLKALAESIKAVGLQEPLTVMEEDPRTHKYTLVNGERRFRALKLIYGDDFRNIMIECYVKAKPVEENQKKLLQIVDNEVRAGLNVSELVTTIRYLERNGIKRREIAKALGGASSSKMTKLYALADYDCPLFLVPLMAMTVNYVNLYELKNLAKKYPDEVKTFCVERTEEGVFSDAHMIAFKARIKEIQSSISSVEDSVEQIQTANKNKEEPPTFVKENDLTTADQEDKTDSQEENTDKYPWKASQSTLGETAATTARADKNEPEEIGAVQEETEENNSSSETSERDNYDISSVDSDEDEAFKFHSPRNETSSKPEKQEQKSQKKLCGVRTILAFDKAANKLICILDDCSQVEVTPSQIKVKV